MASEVERAIEAIIMVTEEPIPPHLLAQILEVTPARVEELCAQLAESYVADDRGFELVRVAGGYRFQSHPDLSGYVERFALEGQSSRLSAAALETLALVAYKQPVSRAQVAEVRGVSVDGVMRTLQHRGYVAEVARDTGPGQAILYGTTTRFLERLGIDSLNHLPPLAQFVPGPEVMDALDAGLRHGGAKSSPDSDHDSIGDSDPLNHAAEVTDDVEQTIDPELGDDRELSVDAEPSVDAERSVDPDPGMDPEQAADPDPADDPEPVDDPELSDDPESVVDSELSLDPGPADDAGLSVDLESVVDSELSLDPGAADDDGLTVDPELAVDPELPPYTGLVGVPVAGDDAQPVDDAEPGDSARPVDDAEPRGVWLAMEPEPADGSASIDDPVPTAVSDPGDNALTDEEPEPTGDRAFVHGSVAVDDSGPIPVSGLGDSALPGDEADQAGDPRPADERIAMDDSEIVDVSAPVDHAERGDSMPANPAPVGDTGTAVVAAPVGDSEMIYQEPAGEEP